MNKILVTGASGFLGWNICRAAKKGWKTFGTIFTQQCKIAGVNIRKVDLTDFGKLKKLFQEIQPDAVIYTAAQSVSDTCQRNRAESQKINVGSSINIAGLCADYSIPCVFTSTDLVFNGLNAPYSEEDSVSPVSLYGEQKVLAEEGMLERYPNTAVCRMPLMFGVSGSGATSFIQPMIKALKEGRELRLFVDEFRTPTGSQSAVHGIFLALEKVTGLIHLGGDERISRYDFGKLFVETLGFSNARLLPCRQKDIIMSAPRPPDVSLVNTRAQALGYKPLSLLEEIKNIALQIG